MVMEIKQVDEDKRIYLDENIAIQVVERLDRRKTRAMARYRYLKESEPEVFDMLLISGRLIEECMKCQLYIDEYYNYLEGEESDLEQKRRRLIIPLNGATMEIAKVNYAIAAERDERLYNECVCSDTLFCDVDGLPATTEMMKKFPVKYFSGIIHEDDYVFERL